MVNPLLFYIELLYNSLFNAIASELTVIQLQKNKRNPLLYFFKVKVIKLQ